MEGDVHHGRIRRLMPIVSIHILQQRGILTGYLLISAYVLCMEGGNVVVLHLNELLHFTTHILRMKGDFGVKSACLRKSDFNPHPAYGGQQHVGLANRLKICILFSVWRMTTWELKATLIILAYVLSVEDDFLQQRGILTGYLLISTHILSVEDDIFIFRKCRIRCYNLNSHPQRVLKLYHCMVF